MSIKLMLIAGARPNFMKLASISQAIRKHNSLNSSTTEFTQIIVHTGQHYDQKMSHIFFDDLNIPKPDINLEVGSGSHAYQTAEIIKKFEPVLLKELPEFLIVVGDVNSTIACALVASKIIYPKNKGISRPQIIHIEAGLRSFDRTMPEEINRILTDSISDILFVTEEQAIINLKNEGIKPQKIQFVGNVMIDTLNRHIEKAKKSNIKEKLKINGPFGLVTLHRPSNVDNSEILSQLVECLINISKKTQLVFPVHPRTLNNLKKFNLIDKIKGEQILLTDPLGYIEFLNLINDSVYVLTDSGGIQEETTVLSIPCITLRENTERPVTVTEGSNYLIGVNPKKIVSTVDLILSGNGKKSKIPKLWDGKAGERIVAKIIDSLN